MDSTLQNNYVLGRRSLETCFYEGYFLFEIIYFAGFDATNSFSVVYFEKTKQQRKKNRPNGCMSYKKYKFFEVRFKKLCETST